MNADAGLWISFGTAVRLIVGWFSIVIGLLNLLAEADRRTGESDFAFLIFHGVLVVGGIMLLALGWLAEDPGLVGYVAGGAVATFGVVLSALPALDSVCCMSAFGVRHGFPFSFLARDFLARDDARWHASGQHLVADLLFWGYVGLFALVIAALVRRVTSRPDDAPAPHRHAEAAALAEQEQEQARADRPSPADGNVGGLP